MSAKAWEHDERRRSRRAPFTLLVQYRYNTHEEFVADYASDLSTGGMFIRTQTPGEEGAMLYLQFFLREQHKLIEGLGRVAHVHSPSQYGANGGMGVEFVHFDEESTAHIQKALLAVKRTG